MGTGGERKAHFSRALTQYLAGQAAAGKRTGIQNAIGNLGGAVAPVVTGHLVQRTGNFWPAFNTSSAVLTTGAVGDGARLTLAGAVRSPRLRLLAQMDSDTLRRQVRGIERK